MDIRRLVRKHILREQEESSGIVFDFGNFKFQGTLVTKPRTGTSSGNVKSTKLYLFQIKVTSSVKLKRASEANFRKVLEDRDVSFIYNGQTYSGVVREVKVNELIDNWYIALKIALTDELEESTEEEDTVQYKKRGNAGTP
jgi:hypothetical protein